MKRALFLDRDGVVNLEKEYLFRIEDFVFIDGVFETCLYFKKKGFLIIIITNQAGIARGYYSEEQYLQLTEWMIQRFKDNGIDISKVYHCPHHPEFSEKCACRKPNPGMILEAEKEFNIDLANSVLVGDKISDIEAGMRAGIRDNYLIITGHALPVRLDPGIKIISNLKNLVTEYGNNTACSYCKNE